MRRKTDQWEKDPPEGVSKSLNKGFKGNRP